MEPKKILIIGPAWIGDMVMAQTLFKIIKQKSPTTVCDVLAPSWTHPLLQCMPEINEAIVSPFAHGELNLVKRYQIAQQIKTEKFDQAIILPNSFKSALVPFLAKIPRRTGWQGEMRWGLLNDIRRLDKKKSTLMIQRFAALGLNKYEELPVNLPFPQLILRDTEVTATLQKYSLATQPKILGLCPGAEYGPAKRWPANYFAKVAKEKTKSGWQVWLLGAAKEQAIAAEIMGHVPECHNLVGKTSLLEAIHLISATTAIVTNDSGLMHVAAAVNKPLVVIYGSSSPNFTPPLSKNVKILSLNLSCSPCYERECPLQHFNCMKELKPQKVLQTLMELVGA